MNKLFKEFSFYIFIVLFINLWFSWGRWSEIKPNNNDIMRYINFFKLNHIDWGEDLLNELTFLQLNEKYQFIMWYTMKIKGRTLRFFVISYFLGGGKGVMRCKIHILIYIHICIHINKIIFLSTSLKLFYGPLKKNKFSR